jgi:leader peptidase (prepilin peptidase)/N-methyltransferase
MEQFLIYLALVLVGLCLGSFAGALAWRLRASQLSQDKAAGESYDKAEYHKLKKLTESSVLNDRSQCLHCDYTLRWYDLIPLVSWLALRGRCRQCHTPIGVLEPLVELGMLLFFVLSYTFWPYGFATPLEITRFILWLVAGIAMAVLTVYDAKWSLLPDKVTFTLIGIGVVTSIISVVQSADILNTLANITGSVVILSGLYLLVYLVSKGKWIGFGDVKLGLGLALLLSDWQLAFVALFAANLIGCLWVIPGLAMGKIKRQSHIPFGPLLIAGCVIAAIAGPSLIESYLILLA